MIRAEPPAPAVPPAWAAAGGDPAAPLAYAAARRAAGAVVYPPAPLTFRALELTPPAAARVVLLGQDPYHGPGQAEGMSFSVPEGLRPPPSLRNIFRELASDLGSPVPATGHLEPWARRGVLLLNTVLTVEQGRAGAHRGRGWEDFTDRLIAHVAGLDQPVVFLLWGAQARAKAPLLTSSRHLVLTAPHPSPLSAHSGFFGSRPFSQANAFLEAAGAGPIDWSLD
ncbi:uracil-DNA glycosylase [Amaricoccus solimangrovi]|uniref:Uracil-DNA glycosylase n=1 Tax=Amaricoccus solimangrovi TaxID=2589815 RepID=A0A501WTE6_9RHOB|nr:uracil-DNA glycosylase [Amaricoccus solimangrovi]TPE52639.1 uracil-DNA glycosylase [Amaricoccus solimangrovi]